jgi:GT2 family glycosyltransferase
MSSRMTDVSTPRTAEEPSNGAPPPSPRVRVIVTQVDGSDLGTALATVERQVYGDISDVVVIGEASGDLATAVTSAETLERAIAETGADVDYLWILHSDARPRPDALAALVSEVERNDASLGGSKLLIAGTGDELESIGSATDVFGDPYSGLDEGEIDLQQYDVVREVAFVSSVSMLVRRDLAQGLRGLDPLLEPVAAGLDFSQRVRLSGGRVITVPSSEVYHQAKCGERGRGWREQAGRLRAMLKAYRPITLIWFVPFHLFVGLIDSVISLLLFRWRPAARNAMSWLWNIWHLPSTFMARRSFSKVRSFSDEELFRFQSSGSVRLREIGSELTDRILFAFDDDHALARNSRRIWSSPGIWGALMAVIAVFIGARVILFTGLPNVRFSFPFEAPTVAANRFFAGWNDSGLGSPDAVHPAIGLTALGGALFFGAEGAARTVLTLVFALMAVIGMGRLAGRLGYRGPGRYMAGLVLLAGPGTAALLGVGSWLSLGAAAVAPWAVRSVFLHPDDRLRSRFSHLGWALLWSLLLMSLSPLLGLIPLIAALLWAVTGGRRSSLVLGLVTLAGAVVAIGFLHDDPGWVTDTGRRLGLVVESWWPILIAVTALPLVFIEVRVRRFALVGAAIGIGALLALRLPWGGPGVEEALLLAASLGTAIVVAAALDQLHFDPGRAIAISGAVVILVVSLGSVLGGRLGLPDGDDNGRYSFASTLAGDGGPGRLLIVSEDRADLVGESRPGPGFWYRLIGGDGTTLDEVWQPEARGGDRQLSDAIDTIASGAELRPGRLLSQFAVDWVVVEGPEIPLDTVLQAQLDLIPIPLAEGARVYQNSESVPLAAGHDDLIWSRKGAGYGGRIDFGRVDLAVNYSSDWSPEPARSRWWTTVSGSKGEATFSGGGTLALAPLASLLLLIGALISIAVGRARR